MSTHDKDRRSGKGISVQRPSLLWPILAALVFVISITVAADDGCTNEELPSLYRWDPEMDHPCTISRISMGEFLRRFGSRGLPPLFETPIVIQAAPNSKRNVGFQDLARSDSIIEFFGSDFNVTLSSSNSFSEHRKTTTLSQYLKGQAVEDTLPDQLSNETWYFFGETYSEHWKEFLIHYELPICHACTRDMVALAFGIGGRGSGVQWHVHGPGFAETIWGRKHWVLQKEKPDFHPDQTSRNWMEYTYSAMAPEERPLECTLDVGDLLYFPDMWFHATINLDPYTAFVSTFTQEHLFV